MRTSPQGDLAAGFPVRRPRVSRHLRVIRVLREADRDEWSGLRDRYVGELPGVTTAVG
ncbi:MAG: hypothetical protein ABI776_02290 [Nocardioidaceae bacterium]